jgi:hypothetical protein
MKSREETLKFFERLEDLYHAYRNAHGHKPDALALTKEDDEFQVSMWRDTPVTKTDAEVTEFLKKDTKQSK